MILCLVVQNWPGITNLVGPFIPHMRDYLVPEEGQLILVPDPPAIFITIQPDAIGYEVQAESKPNFTEGDQQPSGTLVKHLKSICFSLFILFSFFFFSFFVCFRKCDKFTLLKEVIVTDIKFKWSLAIWSKCDAQRQSIQLIH